MEPELVEEASDNDEAIDGLLRLRKSNRTRNPLVADLRRQEAILDEALERAGGEVEPTAVPRQTTMSQPSAASSSKQPDSRPAKARGKGVGDKGKSRAKKSSDDVSGVIPLSGIAANSSADEFLDEDFFNKAPQRARKYRKVSGEDLPDTRVSSIIRLIFIYSPALLLL